MPVDQAAAPRNTKIPDRVKLTGDNDTAAARSDPSTGPALQRGGVVGAVSRVGEEGEAGAAVPVDVEVVQQRVVPAHGSQVSWFEMGVWVGGVNQLDAVTCGKMHNSLPWADMQGEEVGGGLRLPCGLTVVTRSRGSGR